MNPYFLSSVISLLYIFNQDIFYRFRSAAQRLTVYSCKIKIIMVALNKHLEVIQSQCHYIMQR